MDLSEKQSRIWESTLQGWRKSELRVLPFMSFLDFVRDQVVGYLSNGHHAIAASKGMQQPHRFRYRFRPTARSIIEGLLEPYCDGSDFGARDQFLDGHGRTELIISAWRGW